MLQAIMESHYKTMVFADKVKANLILRKYNELVFSGNYFHIKVSGFFNKCERAF